MVSLPWASPHSLAPNHSSGYYLCHLHLSGVLHRHRAPVTCERPVRHDALIISISDSAFSPAAAVTQCLKASYAPARRWIFPSDSCPTLHGFEAQLLDGPASAVLRNSRMWLGACAVDWMVPPAEPVSCVTEVKEWFIQLGIVHCSWEGPQKDVVFNPRGIPWHGTVI